MNAEGGSSDGLTEGNRQTWRSASTKMRGEHSRSAGIFDLSPRSGPLGNAHACRGAPHPAFGHPLPKETGQVRRGAERTPRKSADVDVRHYKEARSAGRPWSVAKAIDPTQRDGVAEQLGQNNSGGETCTLGRACQQYPTESTRGSVVGRRQIVRGLGRSANSHKITRESVGSGPWSVVKAIDPTESDWVVEATSPGLAGRRDPHVGTRPSAISHRITSGVGRRSPSG